MKLLDCVKKSISEYPSLYLHETFEDSKIRVLDHLFGALGNGIKWAKTKDPKKGGYLCEPTYFKSKEYVRKNDQDYGKEKFEKDITLFYSEPFVEVISYESYENIFKGTFSEFNNHPQREEWELNSYSLDNSFKVSDLSNCQYRIIYNLIQRNVEFRRSNYGYIFDFCCWTPYPSFNKTYSIFWKDEAKYIQEDWKVGALYWLEECRKYFNSNRVMTYSYYPSNINNQELEKIIKQGLSSGEYKNFEDVNRAYETNCFTGKNFEELAYERWDKEFERIKVFIDETINLLLSF